MMTEDTLSSVGFLPKMHELTLIRKRYQRVLHLGPVYRIPKKHSLEAPGHERRGTKEMWQQEAMWDSGLILGQKRTLLP